MLVKIALLTAAETSWLATENVKARWVQILIVKVSSKMDDIQVDFNYLPTRNDTNCHNLAMTSKMSNVQDSMNLTALNWIHLPEMTKTTFSKTSSQGHLQVFKWWQNWNIPPGNFSPGIDACISPLSILSPHSSSSLPSIHPLSIFSPPRHVCF